MSENQPEKLNGAIAKLRVLGKAMKDPKVLGRGGLLVLLAYMARYGW